MTSILTQDWKTSLKNEYPQFIQNLDDISCERPLPAAHLMRRAWEDLELDGIFYTNQTPYIYFKEVDRIEPEQVRRLHLQFWNQGVAPLLVIISPTEIYIYSGLASPTQIAQEITQKSSDRLIDILERTADSLELQKFIRSVETGELFREKPKSFDPNLKVDRDLLRNLEIKRNELLEHTSKTDNDIKAINALLWRIIFVCYLIDRQIIDLFYFDEIGLNNINKLKDIFIENEFEVVRNNLYLLFNRLKEDFNGDLFEQNIEIEKQKITHSQIQILKRFLNGDEIKSGQTTLGFWAYDFKVIPIETISGIYEKFIEAEDNQIKKKSGIYYTPRFLAELTLNVALEDWNNLLDKKFLDPACGSGIFLVAIFNRLAEEWLWKNRNASYDERASSLINILQKNIVGVDVSETACRIAAFSLYLAFLDQLEPRAIQRLQKQGDVLPMLVGYNLLVKNFFEDNLLLENQFDLIIGNPPWKRLSGKSKNIMEEWCNKANYTIPQRQLACGFVMKALTHLNNDGRACFLLPAGIIFNHQAKSLIFQRQWFSSCTVEKIINLADLRFYLFDDADRPTLLVRYKEKSSSIQNEYIDYLCPKTEFETLKARILVISPEDQIKIRLQEILYDLSQGESPLIWKQSFWGTPRDKKFLDRLSYLPMLRELVSSIANKSNPKSWIIGQGFQPPCTTDEKNALQSSQWDKDILFLEGDKDINLFIFQSDCSPILDRFSVVRRLPDPRIFSAPHIIISKSLKAAFADFDVVFRHAFQAIYSPQQDKDKLMFLSAFLNSKLAKYFLFHTSSTWGIERGDIRITEMLRLPFWLPEESSSLPNSSLIIRKSIELMESAKKEIKEHNPSERAKIVHGTQEQLDELVYQYYNIDQLEKILIEDTMNVWIPSITPNQKGNRCIPTIQSSKQAERQDYLLTLCSLLNSWIKGGVYQINGKIILSPTIGAGIVVLERARRRELNSDCPPEENSSEALNYVLRRIIALLPREQGNISFLRNLKIFDQNELFIFKPLTYRFWTKTYALNDADEIASAILNSR